MIGTRVPSTITGHLRFRKIGELLDQHVARLEVRNDENVRLAGDGRNNSLGSRRLQRNRTVEPERSIKYAADNLAAIGHLAQRRRIDRQRISGDTVSTAERIATRGAAMPNARTSSIAFCTISRLSRRVG
jgi:hypothetical protein